MNCFSEGVFPYCGIWIENTNKLSFCNSNRLIVGFAKPNVDLVFYERDRWEILFDHLTTSVHGIVIDYDNFSIHARNCLLDGQKALFQKIAHLIIKDNNGELQGSRGF